MRDRRISNKYKKECNRIKTEQIHQFQTYSSKTASTIKSMTLSIHKYPNTTHSIRTLITITIRPKTPIQTHPRKSAKSSPRKSRSSKRPSLCHRKYKISIQSQISKSKSLIKVNNKKRNYQKMIRETKDLAGEKDEEWAEGKAYFRKSSIFIKKTANCSQTQITTSHNLNMTHKRIPNHKKKTTTAH